jgi:hypothetical protein
VNGPHVAATSSVVCELARPTRSSMQPLMHWQLTCGCCTGEVFYEEHDGHAHVWLRVRDDWSLPLEESDRNYFRDCVKPVARDVIDARRCCTPLDHASAELLA